MKCVASCFGAGTDLTPPVASSSARQSFGRVAAFRALARARIGWAPSVASGAVCSQKRMFEQVFGHARDPAGSDIRSACRRREWSAKRYRSHAARGTGLISIHCDPRAIRQLRLDLGTGSRRTRPGLKTPRPRKTIPGMTPKVPVRRTCVRGPAPGSYRASCCLLSLWCPRQDRFANKRP